MKTGTLPYSTGANKLVHCPLVHVDWHPIPLYMYYTGTLFWCSKIWFDCTYVIHFRYTPTPTCINDNNILCKFGCYGNNQTITGQYNNVWLICTLSPCINRVAHSLFDPIVLELCVLSIHTFPKIGNFFTVQSSVYSCNMCGRNQ